MHVRVLLSDAVPTDRQKRTQTTRADLCVGNSGEHNPMIVACLPACLRVCVCVCVCVCASVWLSVCEQLRRWASTGAYIDGNEDLTYDLAHSEW